MLSVLLVQMAKTMLDVINMDLNLLFESFLVFYLLECLILVSVAVWYYHEPKIKVKKIYDPWGFWRK
jgi:hypothetical protein